MSPSKPKETLITTHTNFIKLNCNHDDENLFKVKLDLENQFKNNEKRIKLDNISIIRLNSDKNNLSDYAHDSVVDKVTNAQLMNMTCKQKKNVVFNTANMVEIPQSKLTHLESNSAKSAYSQNTQSQKYTVNDKESIYEKSTITFNDLFDKSHEKIGKATKNGY